MSTIFRGFNETIKCLYLPEQPEEDTLEKNGRYTSVENTNEINLCTANIPYSLLKYACA